MAEPSPEHGNKVGTGQSEGMGASLGLVPQQLRGYKHLPGVQIVVSQNPLRLFVDIRFVAQISQTVRRKGLLGVQMVVSSNPGKDMSVSKEK